jgi:hypothetical protein
LVSGHDGLSTGGLSGNATPKAPIGKLSTPWWPGLTYHLKELPMSKLGRPNRHEAEVRPFAGKSRIQPHAAGVDIGAYEIVACVSGVDDTQIVRTFGTYTADLHDLANWLKEHYIETVAMESTGVYWIPLFETLEDHGFHCCLISANAIKRFPGCKSDVLD